MTTFAWTFYPIQLVIEAGGRISFKDLAEKLTNLDPQRFRSEEIVQRAVEKYNSCLKYDGVNVSFDKTAGKYAQFDIMERDVQSMLHKAIPDMEKWQLYPFKTRKNSKECYVGYPWSKIPLCPGEEEFPRLCDFRAFGEDLCYGRCGVK